MNRFSRLVLAAGIFCLLSGNVLLALDVPERPAHYVTDTAELISPPTESRLEAALRAYESQTTNQIVVATFPSLEGEALEDFSIRLAEKWKVGQADRDNGVILLIFQNERSIRIEVGYGLEGVLPDALAGQIVQQVIVPHFLRNEFENGVLAGVFAIIRATEGEFAASPAGGRGWTREEIEALKIRGDILLAVVGSIVFVFFIIDWLRYRRYLKDHRIYRNRYTFWEWWFRFALLLFVLSILFRMMFYAMLFSRGGYYGGRSGFGGFSGGGGSFGGGGASGRW